MSYRDIRLAAGTAAGLSIEDPIFLCAFGLSKVPVREVVATAYVVVVLCEGAGVEDAFHGLPLAAERGVSVEIDGLQAQGILGRFAAERNVEDGRLYLRMS